jgi:hypothetical protein
MAELHTSDVDFQKTFAYLQNTLDNGDWEFPKLKSTLSRNLGMIDGSQMWCTAH